MAPPPPIRFDLVDLAFRVAAPIALEAAAAKCRKAVVELRAVERGGLERHAAALERRAEELLRWSREHRGQAPIKDQASAQAAVAAVRVRTYYEAEAAVAVADAPAEVAVSDAAAAAAVAVSDAAASAAAAAADNRYYWHRRHAERALRYAVGLLVDDAAAILRLVAAAEAEPDATLAAAPAGIQVALDALRATGDAPDLLWALAYGIDRAERAAVDKSTKEPKPEPKWRRA